MMLTFTEIAEVDEFGEKLRLHLEEVSKGDWNPPFPFGKAPYIHSREPFEFSLGGEDAWAISYKSMYKALKDYGLEKLLNIILADLRATWRNLSSTNGKSDGD